MRVIREPAAMAAELDWVRGRGESVGLVPTMGALHAGHASLVRAAVADGGVVVVSVFVNPLQFGPNEDLAAYPRRLEADVAAAEAAGASYVFAPDRDRMYPDGFRTTVHVAGLTDALEGASRPGHFDGVTTVVAKLLAITGRCRAYFGEKDFQQLQVVRRMAADLSLPATVIGCPTVREPDGLALSSRNAYLDAEDRAAAPVLHRALQAGALAARAARRDAVGTSTYGIPTHSTVTRSRGVRVGAGSAVDVMAMDDIAVDQLAVDQLAVDQLAVDQLAVGVAALDDRAVDDMAARVRAVMATEVAAEPAVTLEYAELIDADRLTAPSPATTTLRLVIAARLGTTRLIDNLAV